MKLFGANSGLSQYMMDQSFVDKTGDEIYEEQGVLSNWANELSPYHQDQLETVKAGLAQNEERMETISSITKPYGDQLRGLGSNPFGGLLINAAADFRGTAHKLKKTTQFFANTSIDAIENLLIMREEIMDAMAQGLINTSFQIPGVTEPFKLDTGDAEEQLAEKKQVAESGGDPYADQRLPRIGEQGEIEKMLEPMASFFLTMFAGGAPLKGASWTTKGIVGGFEAAGTMDLADGNLATALKDMLGEGGFKDLADYLSSKPENAEIGYERLQLRVKNLVEEGSINAIFMGLPMAFRAMKAMGVKFLLGGGATVATTQEAEAGPVSEIGKLLLKSRKEISKIKDASIFNGKLNRKNYDLAKTEVNRVKQNYLAEDGWVEPKIAEGSTKPAVVFNPDGSIKSINWQGVPYKFHISNKGLSTEDHKAELVSTMVNDVKSIVQRAKEGDQTAIKILKEADWYRAMRSRLRTEFGGIADVFVDVIGATSANTGVTVNWDNAVEVLTRFTKGEFDEEIKLFEERIKSGKTVSGKTITALHKDKNNPFKLITKASGKLFGINSPTSTGALLDMFRQIKAGDSPKTKNFAGNLIGSTTDATIDVWAARYLRRAAGYDRIPPNSEVGVSGMHLKGSTNENPRIGGEFGFGQSVFSDANAALKADGLLAEYGGDLANMNDDDLQAIVWFMEKEIWTKNGWTTKAGEGGSLDFEASLAGSANPERVKELRTIINSKNSGEQEILDASVELKNLSAPLQRYVLGVSAERPGNIPTNAKQAEIANDLNSVLVKDDNVVAFQNNSTMGLFGGQVERALNSEIVTRSGFNASDLVGKLVQVGKANNQDAVFVSKVVNETHPNGRPGVELYFAKRKDAEYIKEVTEYIRQMFNVDGFTAITDARFRDRVDLQVGTNAETAGLNGIRLQYIPEFAGGEFNEVTKKAMTLNYGRMVIALEKRYPDINFTKVMHYDTTVYVNRDNPETDWISGGRSYKDIIGPTSE